MTAPLLAAALALLAPALRAKTPRPPAQTGSLSIIVQHENPYHATLRIGPVLADSSLQQAARSGLPLRVHVRTELWRDGFIDDLEGTELYDAVILFDPLSNQFIVRPGPREPAHRFLTFAAARAAVEGDHPLRIAPQREGRFYYTSTLEIETLSLSDLEELERWLQGELQPAVTGERSLPGAVAEGAKRLMIRMLGLPDRRLDARSERFRVGG